MADALAAFVGRTRYVRNVVQARASQDGFGVLAVGVIGDTPMSPPILRRGFDCFGGVSPWPDPLSVARQPAS